MRLTNDEYHARPEVSKSDLDLIARCPAKYKWHKIDGNPRAGSTTFDLGSLVHCLILEPNMVQREFMKAPADAPRRPSSTQRKAAKPSASTQQAIEFWDQFDKESEGKTILSADDWEQAERMAASVAQHPAVQLIFDGDGVAEESFFWTDEATGLDCKCRPDWHSNDREVVVDLKTTRNAGHEFERSLVNFRYHVQAAHYTDGCAAAWGKAPSHFMFICVEKEPPYPVAVYLASPDVIAAGRRQARKDLERLAECRRTHRWPGYGDEIKVLDLPAWMKNKDNAYTDSTFDLLF